MTIPISEILLLSKTAKFPFQPMDYSPWSSKNLIDQNRPKKFMQVGVDVTYMYIDFGGRGLSGFRDIATFKNGKISLSTHGLQVIIKTFKKGRRTQTRLCRAASNKCYTTTSILHCMQLIICRSMMQDSMLRRFS